MAAELEIAFVHEDDGCAVEIHCLACRLTLGRGTEAASISSNAAPAGQPVAFVAHASSVLVSVAVLEAQRPRGPPSSTPQPTSL